MAKHQQFSLKDILERKKEVTDKISTQVRTVSVGMILFVWSVLSSPANNKLAQIGRDLWSWVVLIALFSILSLGADYLQYVLGQVVADIALSNEEHHKTGIYEYPTETLVFRAQYWCYWGKQLFCGLAVLLVVMILIVGFFFLN